MSYSSRLKRKLLRKCPYCKSMTPKETLDIPDSCYCKNCGAYLGEKCKNPIMNVVKAKYNPSKRVQDERNSSV